MRKEEAMNVNVAYLRVVVVLLLCVCVFCGEEQNRGSSSSRRQNSAAIGAIGMLLAMPRGRAKWRRRKQDFGEKMYKILLQISLIGRRQQRRGGDGGDAQHKRVQPLHGFRHQDVQDVLQARK